MALSVHSYRWPRRLLLDGICGDQLWAGNGIVAGSAPATFEAKHHLLPLADGVSVPGTSNTVHVDDLGLFSWAFATVDCVSNMR
eukprot:9003850-Pyramimonas_sp.AAC.1